MGGGLMTRFFIGGGKIVFGIKIFNIMICWAQKKEKYFE